MNGSRYAARKEWLAALIIDEIAHRVLWSNPAIMIATRCFFLVPLAVGWLALSPMAEAQLPSSTPDGGYPANNTLLRQITRSSISMGENR
jgi:hypothetical protein